MSIAAALLWAFATACLSSAFFPGLLLVRASSLSWPVGEAAEPVTLDTDQRRGHSLLPVLWQRLDISRDGIEDGAHQVHVVKPEDPWAVVGGDNCAIRQGVKGQE